MNTSGRAMSLVQAVNSCLNADRSLRDPSTHTMARRWAQGWQEDGPGKRGPSIPERPPGWAPSEKPSECGGCYDWQWMGRHVAGVQRGFTLVPQFSSTQSTRESQ